MMEYADSPEATVSAINARELDANVAFLLDYPGLDSLFDQRPGLRADLCSAAHDVAEAAFARRSPQALRTAHVTLAHLYRDHFATPGPGQHLANQFNPVLLEVRRILELPWERYERNRCRDWSGIGPDKFAAAYLALLAEHRAAHHPLSNFLAEKADRDGICRYIACDGALALNFFTLIALTLIGEENQIAKREVVNNLDDEAGASDAQMHTRLISNSVASVGATPDSTQLASGLGWRGLAGLNLFYMLGINRRWRNEYIGAMGVGESIDPPHNAKVTRGCRRVGLGQETTIFYTAHIELEMEHGDDWLKYVMVPAAERYPGAASDVLTGAEMRLNTCADYYDEQLEGLQSSTSQLSL
ncbi:hypothetical protein ABIE67_007923 [Streptomyces sp. V4I8]|uniref:iron-containing redox enzyme family protein n=1 Tax=Streptomyces sp. V4I8 TaxID=3156469 RepID=UPI003511970F